LVHRYKLEGRIQEICSPIHTSFKHTLGVVCKVRSPESVVCAAIAGCREYTICGQQLDRIYGSQAGLNIGSHGPDDTEADLKEKDNSEEHDGSMTDVVGKVAQTFASIIVVG
jgi:hypothetical protein